MEKLLWTFEDLKRFAGHPDRPVRFWALERLTKLFPNQAGDVAVTMLDDQGMFIAGKALNFLAKTGETEKYGPTLLEHLKRAEGDHFSRLALTLAELGYRPALPVVLEQVNQDDKKVNLNEYLSLTRTLGEFGGDEACQTLWTLLEQESLQKEGVTVSSSN